MDSLRELLAIVVFVVFALVFLRVMIPSVISLIKRIKQPDTKTKAKVLKKQCDTGTGEFSADGVRLGKKVYTVVFETSKRQEIEFSVLADEYAHLNDGDLGYLTYRADRFLEFTKDTLLEEDEFYEKD